MPDEWNKPWNPLVVCVCIWKFRWWSVSTGKLEFWMKLVVFYESFTVQLEEFSGNPAVLRNKSFIILLCVQDPLMSIYDFIAGFCEAEAFSFPTKASDIIFAGVLNDLWVNPTDGSVVLFVVAATKWWFSIRSTLVNAPTFTGFGYLWWCRSDTTGNNINNTRRRIKSTRPHTTTTATSRQYNGGPVCVTFESFYVYGIIQTQDGLIAIFKCIICFQRKALDCASLDGRSFSVDK